MESKTQMPVEEYTYDPFDLSILGASLWQSDDDTKTTATPEQGDIANDNEDLLSEDSADNDELKFRSHMVEEKQELCPFVCAGGKDFPACQELAQIPRSFIELKSVRSVPLFLISPIFMHSG